MKRLLIALLACLLLCGCGSPAEETTAPTELLPAVTPTEPAGSYQPGSDLELASNGAVRVYPQALEGIQAIYMAGDDLLVFSGSDTTTITRLAGENLFRVAEVRLDLFLSPDAPSLYITQDRVAYFDYQTRELVYLDQDLREINRLAMPEDMLGEPVLTADRMELYYCTASGVRCLDQETEISRLLKQMHFKNQQMGGLLMGGSVLRVDVDDGEGNCETLFLDTQTGAMVGGMGDDLKLTTGDSCFYAIDTEGVVEQMLFGTQQEIQMLTPVNYQDSGEFLPGSHGAVVLADAGETAQLDYYDLETGMRTAALALPEGMQPGGYAQTADETCVYFLDRAEEAGCHTIYRWDLTATPTADETVYTGQRYTLAEPDEDGYGECEIYAQVLSRHYGLEILFGTDATDTQPWDYDLVAEYQVPVILDALIQLEAILSHYPEGFFAQCLEGMEDGALTLCLVRGMNGSHESGSLDTADGIQFWIDNHAYVAIAMGEKFEQTFYHEMFHVMETRVLSESIAYYRWDELNPKGFDYDYDYVANLDRDGSEYLEEKTRSFIDSYSMSYPKEDRARIMEYACMEGNENFFISYTMQKKLRTLCEGIREAYDLEDHPEPFLWEQYLESPLTPQE